MFTNANMLKTSCKKGTPRLFTLLLLSLVLSNGCSLKLFELPIESVNKETSGKPENEKIRTILKDRAEKFPREVLDDEEDKRSVRRDLQHFLDSEGKYEEWKKYQKDADVKLFASDENSMDGLLLREDKLRVWDWKAQKPTENQSPNDNESFDTLLSFIHLSDIQFHDERVYMFSRELTKFFDKFVGSFDHDPDMALYDHSYYLSLIRTTNLLHDRLKEKQGREPRFMIHTGDAIDMGVVSEMYEVIYISNKLKIPWYNVLGNHDYQVYGNISSKDVGVIKPSMGFQTVNSRYNFINMHGKGFDVDGLVYFSPDNAPHTKSFLFDSVYNGFDMQGRPFESSAKLPKFSQGIQYPDYLKENILYNAEKQLLIFRNRAMTEIDKDKLLALSQESSYQTAIEQLYVRSLDFRRDNPCGIKECPGYYHFEALQPKNGEPGVLCIVLDTTTKDFRYAKGTVYRHNEVNNPPEKGKKLEQINWLRGILKDYSLERNWMVLVFGHHQLGKEGFFDDSYDKLIDIFSEPKYNVMAYLCGHTHEHKIEYNKNTNFPESFGFWKIITDSIMEYPKRGSLVTLRNRADGKWEIVIQSFWPYFLERLDSDAPLVLRNAKKCFDASKKDSGSNKRKRYDKLAQEHHDVILTFEYPKTK